jgi:hypothetical protein
VRDNESLRVYDGGRDGLRFILLRARANVRDNESLRVYDGGRDGLRFVLLRNRADMWNYTVLSGYELLFDAWREHADGGAVLCECGLQERLLQRN